MTDFGTDLAVSPNADGVLDISPMLNYSSGLATLIQSLICRQMCVRGSIVGAPNEGIDLRTYLRTGLTQQQLAGLPAVVQKELQRDERVQKADVAGSYDTATNALTLTETITTAQGTFTLTLAVSAVTVTLLSQSP